MDQIFGRLTRHGQKEQVDWTVVLDTESFYGYQALTRSLKWLGMWRAEGNHPKCASPGSGKVGEAVRDCDEIISVVGLELLRHLQGQPFNMYSLVLFPPGCTEKLGNDFHRHAAEFCSAAACSILALNVVGEGSNDEELADEVGELVKLWPRHAGAGCLFWLHIRRDVLSDMPSGEID